MIDFNAFFSLVDFGVIIQSLGWICLGVITFVEKFGPKDKKPWTAIFTFIGKLITKDFSESQKTLMDRVEVLSDKIEAVAESVEETRAIAARVRILRFADEIIGKQAHSRESYVQIFADIDTYDRYCRSHLDFKNHNTVSAQKLIADAYDERSRKNDFTY
nr:MAG TPA: hypothetical protein [Caudoviricetes sp.]